MERRARGDPAQNPFLGGKGAACGIRFFLGDGKDLVDDGAVQNRWDEIRSDALESVGACVTLGEKGRGGRLYGDDLNSGIFGFQVFSYSRQRSARSHARHEEVDLPFGIVPDLLGGGLAVCLRVGGVIKLRGNEASFCGFGKRFCLVDRSLHSFCAVGQHDLSAVGGKKRAPFDAHGLGHGENDPIAARGGDGGKPDPRVSAGGFDDDRPFAE